jgi:CHAD domain-containing protein
MGDGALGSDTGRGRADARPARARARARAEPSSSPDGTGDGERAAPSSDVAGRVPVLGRRSTVEDLVRHAIADGSQRLLANDPVIRASDDADAVHHARVATRRLRSDLRTLSKLVDVERTEPIRDELQWLGGLLGVVRDADVMGETLREAAADGDPIAERALAGLLDRLREQRSVAHLTLVDAMRSARYAALVDSLRCAVESPPLRSGAAARAARRPARRAVRRAYRRVDRYARGLGGDPAEADLHELRKRVKRARYAAELVDPVLGGSTAKFADRLASLQSVLGARQDRATARAWLASLPEHADAEEAFAAGRLLERLVVHPVPRPKWRRKLRRAHRLRPR